MEADEVQRLPVSCSALDPELARATRAFVDAQLSERAMAAVTNDEDSPLAERVRDFVLLRRTRRPLLGTRRAQAGFVDTIGDLRDRSKALPRARAMRHGRVERARGQPALALGAGGHPSRLSPHLLAQPPRRRRATDSLGTGSPPTSRG